MQQKRKAVEEAKLAKSKAKEDAEKKKLSEMFKGMPQQAVPVQSAVGTGQRKFEDVMAEEERFEAQQAVEDQKRA